jgi:hypothetical protein
MRNLVKRAIEGVCFLARMSFFVVEGEPRPKVYTELRVARKACTSPLWQVRTFYTLAEAAAAREQCKERGAQEGERKRARITTPVLTGEQAQLLADPCEDEDEEKKNDSSFGRWLSAQHYGDAAAYHDPAQAREAAEHKAWFRAYTERKEQKRKEREARAKAEAEMNEARRRGDWPPPPPPRPKPQRQKAPAPKGAADDIDAALKALEISVSAKQVTLEMLKSAKKKLTLRHHPDKNPHNVDKATIMFRKTIESYELLTNRLFNL